MTTEPVAADAPTPRQSNVLQRFAGVLFAPAETFQEIARRPDVLWPLLVVVLFGYLTTAVIVPHIDMSSIYAQQAEAMKKRNANLDQEDLERIQRFTAASTKIASFVMPALMIAWYALVAAVLQFAFRLMGGQGTYKQAMSATIYSWTPLLILSVITSVVVLARGTFDPMTAQTLVKSNLAFLVDLKEQPALFSLLAALDVFAIWTIVLLVFGFAALSKLSWKMSAGIIVSLWLALVLVRTGWASLMASRMG